MRSELLLQHHITITQIHFDLSAGWSQQPSSAFLLGWCSYCFKSGGGDAVSVLFLCSLPFWVVGCVTASWHKGHVHHFGRRYEKPLTRQKWNNSSPLRCKSFNLILWAQRIASTRGFIAIQTFSVNPDYSSSPCSYLMAVYIPTEVWLWGNLPTKLTFLTL